MSTVEISPPIKSVTYTGPDRRYEFSSYNGNNKRSDSKRRKARTLFLEADVLEVEIVPTPLDVSTLGQYGHQIENYNTRANQVGMFVDTLV